MSSLAIGIDIGGTNISVVRTLDSKTHESQKHSIPSDLKNFIKTLGELVVSQIQQAGQIDITEITVGIGCAGSLTHEGKVISSPNILYLNESNLKEILQKEIARKLKMELPEISLQNLEIQNDAYTATTGELIFGNNTTLGNNTSNSDFIFLAFGTGIGAGRVIAKKQYSGANNFWGEVGHIFISEQDLGTCGCGRTGCWEQMASGTALARYIKEAQDQDKAPELSAIKAKDMTGKDFTEAFLENGDSNPALKNECQKIVRELAVWMVRGMKNLINVCDPGCIILSGGLMNLGGELFEMLKEEMTTQPGPKCELKIANNIEWGGAMGAAHLGKSQNRLKE